MDRFRKFMVSAAHKYRLPVYRVAGTRLLREPRAFYNELIMQTRCSKKKISLASLYIGTGSNEQYLIHELHKAVRRNPELQLNVIVDKNRGTRRSSDGTSTATICGKFYERLKKNVNICFFQMPKSLDSSDVLLLVETLLPERLNEIFQTFHLKIYVFDDCVILGGGNLSEEYFINRQDRYMVIRCAPLAGLYHHFIEILNKYSFHLRPGEGGKDGCGSANYFLKPPEQSEINKLSTELDNMLFIAYKENILGKKDFEKAKQEETIVLPTFQLKALGIESDEQILLDFLRPLTYDGMSNVPQKGDALFFASAYLNFMDNFTELLAYSKSSVFVMTASPTSNGFHSATGPAAALPHAYSLLEHLFVSKFNAIREDRVSEHVGMLEYSREDWTFHGKGLWFVPRNEHGVSGTIIGSSNYGWRSVLRDMEGQAWVHTISPLLRKQLLDEWVSMKSQCVGVEDKYFGWQIRDTNKSLLGSSRLWRRMFLERIKMFM
jgi:CDP-diacylglycerol---glycerol-3-phosphate 3-phosphatidyltransferase